MAQPLKKSEELFKFKASILIPMLNEENSILFILNKLKIALSHQTYEIIIIDDGSTDASHEQVKSFINFNPSVEIKYIFQKNQGKGSAIRRAVQEAQGEILVIQDADLEYDPQDIPILLKLFNDNTQVVYGSRILMKQNKQRSSFFFYWGGRLVTLTTNILFQANLTDEATGYKLFHSSVIKNISFKHNDFAWEPEITAKILKKKIKIAEHPIHYHPRSKKEGKKITWRDGFKAIYVLFSEFLKK